MQQLQKHLYASKGSFEFNNYIEENGNTDQLPLPNKIWSKINAELEQIMPSIFPAHNITSDLSLKQVSQIGYRKL
jgi:hypothetical protein